VLSDKDASRLEDSYAKLYDMSQESKIGGAAKREGDIVYDSLRKIGGGIIGGGVSMGTPGGNEFGKMNVTLSLIKAGIDALVVKKNAVVVA
jgi:hypothetical protein